ncbi:glycerate kinase, partial [Anaerospora hongkongensis]
MRIIIAPDSYKGSVSALGVAEAMERGVLHIFPDAEIIKIPIADGGEGTVDALVTATGGQKLYQAVRGPLGDTIEAYWGVLGDGETA